MNCVLRTRKMTTNALDLTSRFPDRLVASAFANQLIRKLVHFCVGRPPRLVSRCKQNRGDGSRRKKRGRAREDGGRSQA
jgi:hypothetical protein